MWAELRTRGIESGIPTNKSTAHAELLFTPKDHLFIVDYNF